MWIELSDAGAALAAPDDFRQFHVLPVADLSAADVDHVLRTSGWGRVEGNDVLISIPVLRARGPQSEAWSAGLDSMLEFAATRDWITADGAFVRAHIEPSPLVHLKGNTT